MGVERGEKVEEGSSRKEMEAQLQKYSADFKGALRLLGRSKKDKSTTLNIDMMDTKLKAMGITVPPTIQEEDDEADVPTRTKMKRRRFLKRLAQMDHLRTFRRRSGSVKDEVVAGDIETATIGLYEKDGEATPLVSSEESETSNARMLKWLTKFDEKFKDNIAKRIRTPGFRSEAGSTLALKRGGDIEIGHLSLEGDLEVEEGAKVKVKGELDLTTVDSEVEVDDKEEEASRKRRRRRLVATKDSTDAEKKAAVQTKKGVSSIAGNVELDGDKAKIVV